RRARGAGLSHGRAQLLSPWRARAGRALRDASRPRAHARRARPGAAGRLLHGGASGEPEPDRREGDGGGRGGGAGGARGVRRARRRRGRGRALPPAGAVAQSGAPARGRRAGARWSALLAPPAHVRVVSLEPDIDGARELARSHNLIPLSYTFIEDCETPVSGFLKLRT